MGRAIVIENWCQTNEACFDPEVPRYRGVRTDRFTYVRYPNGEQELYDLVRDPYETRSRHDSSRYGRQRRALSDLLDQVESCGARDCRVGPDVSLEIDYDRGRRPAGGACSRSGVAIKPAGDDGGRALEATLLLAGGKRITDDDAPIRFKLRSRDLKRRESTAIEVDVTVLDGRVKGVSGKVPRPC